MKVEDIKDPKLRARVKEALGRADALRADLMRDPVFSQPQATPKANRRIRQSQKPLLNKLETEAMAWLRTTYPHFKFQPHCMRLEIANGCWFSPDIVGTCDGTRNVSLHEVKGPMAWDDAIVKLKVVARAWPCFSVSIMWKIDGQWKEQLVLP